MSNNFHTSIQLLVLVCWIGVFLYSFLYKYKYLSKLQKYLIPVVSVVSCIRYSTLFNVVQFHTDWFAFVYYLSGILVPLLFAVLLHHKEVQTDRRLSAEKSLQIFKNITYNSSRAICAMDIETGNMLYTNKRYEQLYFGKTDDNIEDFCDPEHVKVYLDNNKKAIAAGGKVLIFCEPTHTGEMKNFKKFYAVVDGREVVITMSTDYECV